MVRRLKCTISATPRCILRTLRRKAMGDQKPKRDYTANQQKIIKRYYDNLDTISLDRLAELVGELYLAEGKKKERAWQSVRKAMEKLEVPKARIEHLMTHKNPVLVAELV